MSQVIDVKLEDNLQEETQARPSPLAVLRSRNFRLLWIGEAISLLGDQFYMIALPWLVLQLTGNALAVGTVLAVAAIPRALFMLVGGALVDRFSPRSLMLGSNLVRFGLVVLLAGLVLTGTIELWMLYVMALFFGLADAFFYPAQSAIVPQLVKERDLPTANALVQGTAQLSLFVGPMLAGGLIALFSGGQTTTGSENAMFLRVLVWPSPLTRPHSQPCPQPCATTAPPLSAMTSSLVAMSRSRKSPLDNFLCMASSLPPHEGNQDKRDKRKGDQQSP